MSVLTMPYDLIDQYGDPRVKDWTFMKNPTPIFFLMVIYVLVVYVVLPIYMKNRKPYSLKPVLFYYNTFQIIACSLTIYRVLTAGWTTHYTLGCQPVDYSNDPLAIRMLEMIYWTFILKIIDMTETGFFILRKKYRQVSKLHVYHHTSTVLMVWGGAKFVGGGMISFPIIINSFIHVMMYTYYLLSSLGPEWQKRLTPWKRRLTIAQITQFGILTLHSTQMMLPSCPLPSIILPFYIPNFIVNYMMFADFYKTNYLKKRRQPQENVIQNSDVKKHE